MCDYFLSIENQTSLKEYSNPFECNEYLVIKQKTQFQDGKQAYQKKYDEVEEVR